MSELEELDKRQYEVLFESRLDGVRYMRRMTYKEATEHSYDYRVRIVSLRRADDDRPV